MDWKHAVIDILTAYRACLEGRRGGLTPHSILYPKQKLDISLKAAYIEQINKHNRKVALRNRLKRKI